MTARREMLRPKEEPSTEVEPCGCEMMLRLLAKAGGSHARSVIESGKTDVRFFTPKDWMLHMNEEERVLEVLVRRGRFPRSSLRRIVREHEDIRKMLEHTGSIPSDLARAHAKFEDAEVERMGLMPKEDE